MAVALAEMTPTVSEPTESSKVLRQLMVRAGFGVRALSRASGVSEAYIHKLRAGRDQRTHQVIKASPEILRMLAFGLSRGNEQRQAEAYEELMAAAGYLPGEGEPEPTGQSMGLLDALHAELRILNEKVDRLLSRDVVGGSEGSLSPTRVGQRLLGRSLERLESLSDDDLDQFFDWLDWQRVRGNRRSSEAPDPS